ncbi:MAG: alpha-amylase family glycosyl hydrolase [Verrucomicrobia bacterium]|nr:alpha-amylase family glycosyl hydrolase [Verrucomicrobiota bacterium]
MKTELDRMDWIPDALVYQINLRSLAYREPHNAFEAAAEPAPTQSPLDYVTSHLSVIEALGANTLYLMPPYPMGLTDRKGIGSPYSVRDFGAVDPEYGSLDQLADFVRTAHLRGLKVIFDITPNHTSRDHIWTRSHPEYYVHADDGSLFYDWDWSDTAKLNYQNADLRAAMHEVYDKWLGFLGPDKHGQPSGIDGFRFDMAHFINDLSFWESSLPALRAKYADRELLFLAECYGTANNMALFQRGMGAAYDDDFYKICQYGYARDAYGQSIIALSDEARHHGEFADKCTAFERGGMAGAVERALLNYLEATPSAPTPGSRSPVLLRYTDNHDEGRGVFRFGPGAVRAMNQLIFMAPDTMPMLLTGQEFGAENRPPIHERIGTCDKGYRFITPAGSGTRAGVELEGNCFARSHEQRQDWLSFYKALFALRVSQPALRRGTFALLDAQEESAPEARSVIAFSRARDGTLLHCAVNLGPEHRRFGNPDLITGDILHGELTDGGLAPFGCIVTRKPQHERH